MRNSACVSIALSAAFLAFTTSVLAQEPEATLVPGSTTEVVKKVDKTGWHPLLKVGGNFALGQTNNVPGSADGMAVNFGALVNGGLVYLDPSQQHEWASDLLWQLAYARTPVVDAWVKSADSIDLNSAYLYHVPNAPWFGPFFSLRLTTPMLPGYEVRPANTSLIELEPREELGEDGTGAIVDGQGNAIDASSARVQEVTAGNKIELTGAFSPLTLRETLGLFAIFSEQDIFKLDTRLGFSAWETFVRDGYLVADDARTADVLELRPMQDSVQLGPQLGILATGLIKPSVTYGLGAMFMQPVYTNADTDLTGLDLLNMEFSATLGVKVFEFLSLDYAFKALKQPLVIDQWQITNNLLITISFMLVGEAAAAQ